MPNIRDVVQALSRRPGVDAVIVLGEDGLPIDSHMEDGLDAEGVAALVPSVVAACKRLGDSAGRGHFDAGVVEFASGLLLVSTITSDSLVGILIAPGTNVGALLYEIKRHRSAIASLL